MKNQSWFLFLFLTTALPFAQSDSFDALIRDKITNPDRQNTDLRWITPELRSVLIQRLKSWSFAAGNRETAELGLLTLNDEETIEQLVQKYHQEDHNAWSRLELSAREGVIPKLIEDVIKGPGPDMFGGSDVVPASRQHISTTIILYSIRRSTVFPRATELWAKNAADMLSTGWPPVQRKVFSQTQEWWSKNKDAILARQYEKATWLPAEKITLEFPKAKATPNAAESIQPPKSGEKELRGE